MGCCYLSIRAVKWDIVISSLFSSQPPFVPTGRGSSSASFSFYINQIPDLVSLNIENMSEASCRVALESALPALILICILTPSGSVEIQEFLPCPYFCRIENHLAAVQKWLLHKRPSSICTDWGHSVHLLTDSFLVRGVRISGSWSFASFSFAVFVNMEVSKCKRALNMFSVIISLTFFCEWDAKFG